MPKIDIKGNNVTKNHYLIFLSLLGVKDAQPKLSGNYLKSIKLERKYVV